MSPAQPAFVLAGGSWHIPAHYQAFHDVVSARGLKIIVPPLPSGVEGRVDAPFEADTKAVADAVRGLVEQGSDVVVIGHSSGGISAAEAAHGLGVRERAAKGLPGGVRSLVLVSGLGEPAGTQPQWDEESLASKAADTMAFEGDYIVLKPGPVLVDSFYHDVPADQHQGLLDMLVKQPASAAAYVLKNPAYEEVDCIYVYCEDDRALRLPAQKRTVGRLRESGVKMKEVLLPSGHFPFLSMPDKLLDAILEAV